jgi:hypothetical protein
MESTGSLNLGHSIQDGRMRFKREGVSFLIISAVGSNADGSGSSPATCATMAVARHGYGGGTLDMGGNSALAGLSRCG